MPISDSLFLREYINEIEPGIDLNYEFEAPQKMGYGLDWPIRYNDVEAWYTHVEQFIGVCGNMDGLEAMPDGHFMKPFDLTIVERSEEHTSELQSH